MTSKLDLISVAEFPKEIQPVPTDNLLDVYKTCLRLQQLCERKKLAGVSALQAGVPWALFILRWWPGLHETDWHYYFNPRYTPLTEEVHPVLMRFANVEQRDCRYFLVKRYKHIEYYTQELLVKTQPELVERVGTDNEFGVFVQNECELLAGRLPHLVGEEYLLKNYSRKAIQEYARLSASSQRNNCETSHFRGK